MALFSLIIGERARHTRRARRPPVTSGGLFVGPGTTHSPPPQRSTPHHASSGTPPDGADRRRDEPVDTTFAVYDTTLRDGAQQEGMNLSVLDKLAIAPLLDELGVGFIEGGWPGAIPKEH